VKTLKASYQKLARNGDVAAFMQALQALPLADGSGPGDARETARPLIREDLHLVCFDYVWS
jgi:hypothetical protein